MGFNTALIIRNDFLHEIAKDAEFGEKVRSAVVMGDRARGLYNSFDVLQSQHADTAQVVVISANSIRSFGWGYWQDSDEELLRRVADHHGFRLVRKPSRNLAGEKADG
jgi:hypothetical protein